jgi:2-dehydropantoate 2-reductase
MNSDSILILGTGALATFFAARFASAGISVTMLGSWKQGINAINKKGVQVDGDSRVFPVHATADPDACTGFHFAMVLVKAWQTEHAAEHLTGCLAENGIALTLQNGLGNDTILSNYLGLRRVAQGVTTLGSFLVAPGLVHLGGAGPISLESNPRLSPLEEMIRRAGFEVKTVADIQSLIWGKLVISSAIVPLTALLRVKNGELLNLPSARYLMGQLTLETSMLANKLGIVLPFVNAELAVEEVAARTAENRSSMLRDILRGAPTEIDAINGAIIHLADQEHVHVPVNRVVWSLVKAIPVRGKIKM